MRKKQARLGRILAGIVAGNAAGGLLWLVASGLVRWFNQAEFYATFPSLFLVPMAIGYVAMWIWRPKGLGMGGVVLGTFACTLVGLIGAWVLLGEGVVCLVMVSPILWGGVILGAFACSAVDKSDDRLQISIVPLVLIGVVIEPLVRGSQTGVVTDELVIQAPPRKVWPHVLAFPEIPDRPDYWLFRLGLPYPMATTNAGNFVGAARACQFSGGAVFEEVVREFDPERRLTFDIVKSPPDPELLGHLDAQRGQFELRDNGNGTTTLIGRTWYTLHVRPAWYFDWWTHQVFRAVHQRVMVHVKTLAEKGV